MGQNAFLNKIEANHKAELHKARIVSTQFCADAAAMAANEVFQRKGEKIAEFLEKFFEYATDIAEMTMRDAKDDKTFEYTKVKVDERLAEILGDKFVPWEERYR